MQAQEKPPGEGTGSPSTLSVKQPPTWGHKVPSPCMSFLWGKQRKANRSGRTVER